MNTEQVLMEMIQNPGKKFTLGVLVASLVDGYPFVNCGGSDIHWTLAGFLDAYPNTTWTEYKEPQGVEFQARLKFDNEGFYSGSNLHVGIRQFLGVMIGMLVRRQNRRPPLKAITQEKHND